MGLALNRQIRRLTESQLAKDSLTAVFAQFSNSAFSLITAVMFARLLGVAEFGAYTVAFSWAVLLSVLGRIGLDSYVTRELAIGLDQKNWPRSFGILLSVVMLTLAISCFLSLAVYAVFLWLDPQIDLALKRLFGYSCLLAPILSLEVITSAVLKAAGYSSAAVWIRFFIRPLLLIAVLLAATTLSYIFTGVEAILSQMWTLLLGVVLLIIAVFVLLPRELTGSRPKFDIGADSRGGIRFLAMAGLGLLISNTDLVMLGFISSVEEAGNYRVASRVASVIGLTLIAVSLPLGPRIAVLYRASSSEKLREIYSKANALSLILSVPLCAVFVMYSSELLSIFGTEFRSASTLLVVLALIAFFGVVMGPASLCLSMMGKEKIVTKFLAVAAILNILLNLLLIPDYGAMGAVVASAITVVTWKLVIWYRLYLELKILPAGLGLLIKRGPAIS